MAKILCGDAGDSASRRLIWRGGGFASNQAEDERPMNGTLIGNKADFAIEYIVNSDFPYLMGHMCIWLGGQPVGYMPEEIMLLPAVNALEGIVRKSRDLPSKLQAAGKAEYMKQFKRNECDYIAHISESFDDFSIWIYLSDPIVFVWQLRSTPYHCYNNIPLGINVNMVSAATVTEVVSQVAFQIRSIGKHPLN